MNVRAKKIAKAVGVSAPVVSKVLFGGSSSVRVGEASRRKVEAAAANMGYRPNASARVLSHGKFNAVGFVVLGTDNEVMVSAGSAGVVAGICRILHRHGKHMTYAYVHADELEGDRLPKVIGEATAGGIT